MLNSKVYVAKRLRVGSERGMEMAATSDEEMESLVRNFEQIYQGYIDAMTEIQTLKLSYGTEARRREALEATCNDLKTDNERVRRLYNESLSKLTNQIKCHAKCKSLKEELKKANDRVFSLEDEHKEMTVILKQENEMKINDLEKRISCSLLQQAADEAAIKQLQQDLVAHKSLIDTLTNNLEHVTSDVDLKYHREIHELKDWIMVEQEEKNMLHKKLQDTENELQIIRAKQAEQQRESISIRHVETLKQKVMKLRKENESLKRWLHHSEA